MATLGTPRREVKEETITEIQELLDNPFNVTVERILHKLTLTDLIEISSQLRKAGFKTSEEKF